MNFAVITSGGKQYAVSPGTRVKLEKLDGKEGDSVMFQTLFIGDTEGNKIEMGTPSLGEKVQGKILKHFRGDKISIVKFKRKVRYRRNRGHRQHFTEVEITKL